MNFGHFFQIENCRLRKSCQWTKKPIPHSAICSLVDGQPLNISIFQCKREEPEIISRFIRDSMIKSTYTTFISSIFYSV